MFEEDVLGEEARGVLKCRALEMLTAAQCEIPEASHFQPLDSHRNVVSPYLCNPSGVF